jgi:alkylhydroperoxidase/carboxymuconolactone decarboxylase family protein YurZ
MEEHVLWHNRQVGESTNYNNICYTKKNINSFDDKTKILLQLALANILQYPNGTKSHIKAALAAGATTEELTETLISTTFERNNLRTQNRYQRLNSSVNF